MNDYILFVAQEANFASRAILVPHDKFMSLKKWANDIKYLKCLAKQTILNNVNIQNLVIEDYLFKGNSGAPIDKKLGKIVSDIIFYADYTMEDCYLHLDDKIWFKDAKIIYKTGFDHVKTYNRLVKKYKPKMSFLILTRDIHK